MGEIVHDSGNNLGKEYLHVGFWARVVAFLIDNFILCVAGYIVAVLLGIDPEVENNFFKLLGNVFYWLYYALMESSEWQATLGKKALGMKVVDIQGNRIGFGRATGRYFAKIISAIPLCVGFIAIGITRKKQGFHDMIAGTYVVYNDVE